MALIVLVAGLPVPTLACDGELLAIARQIDHPTSYTEVRSDHCEGRYGGLFSRRRDTFVSIVGLERVPSPASLGPETELELAWETDSSDDLRLSAVYLQPRLFFRMDANVAKSDRFIWPLDRLASIQGGSLDADRIAVAVFRRDASTDAEFLIPSARAGAAGDAPYRLSLEAIKQLERIDWSLTQDDRPSPVATGTHPTPVARNQFVQIAFPLDALSSEGHYTLTLTGALPNGATTVQQARISNGGL